MDQREEKPHVSMAAVCLSSVLGTATRKHHVSASVGGARLLLSGEVKVRSL